MSGCSVASIQLLLGLASVGAGVSLGYRTAKGIPIGEDERVMLTYLPAGLTASFGSLSGLLGAEIRASRTKREASLGEELTGMGYGIAGGAILGAAGTAIGYGLGYVAGSLF